MIRVSRRPPSEYRWRIFCYFFCINIYFTWYWHPVESLCNYKHLNLDSRGKFEQGLVLSTQHSGSFFVLESHIPLYFHIDILCPISANLASQEQSNLESCTVALVKSWIPKIPFLTQFENESDATLLHVRDCNWQYGAVLITAHITTNIFKFY